MRILRVNKAIRKYGCSNGMTCYFSRVLWSTYTRAYTVTVFTGENFRKINKFKNLSHLLIVNLRKKQLLTQIIKSQ